MTDQKQQRQEQRQMPLSAGVQDLEKACLDDVTGGMQPQSSPPSPSWTHPFDSGTAPPAKAGQSTYMNLPREGRTATHPELNEFYLTGKISPETMHQISQALGKGHIVK